MKFSPPFKVSYVLSQGFSLNYNPYYSEGGLLGHTGLDYQAAHLSPIIAVADSYCYSIMNKGNSDLMRYRAVYTLVEDKGTWYEVSYGHLIDINAEIGNLKKGAPIGTQGNTGDVASGGKKVTAQEKYAGSTKGTHLHFQVRLVKPVGKKEGTCLKDVKGYLKYMGMFWTVPQYKNGFNGCIDPAPFFETLISTLRYGDKGSQVKILQRLLGIPVDGIFGLGTEKVVKEFQKENKLTPDGIVGALTASKLQ